jgi:hypothetical protein
MGAHLAVQLRLHRRPRQYLTTRVPARGTVCEPDVVPFAEPAATTQALQATGASSKATLIPPMLRRMLAD